MNALQLRKFVKLIENPLRLGMPFQFDHQAQAMTVRFIAQIPNRLNPTLAHQTDNPLDNRRLADLIRNRAKDDMHRTAAPLLKISRRPNRHAPLASRVSLLQIIADNNLGASRKIRPFDKLHQIIHRNIVNRLVMIDEIGNRADQFAQIVRRDAGRHANRDATGAVQQQIGQTRRQHSRLLLRAIIILGKINGVHVNIGQHLAGDSGHPRLGIAHSGRLVPILTAEVPLPVHQGITQRKSLGHPRHRIINRLVAVRMIFAQHLANQTRALLVSRPRPQTHIVHGKQNAPMNWLQAIAGIRQRARHNHAHSIVKIAAAHLLVDVDGADCADVSVS